ncbi:MAG: hypothetical protein ACI83D_000154 [Planctomycetota bacterium]|jgi:hypothetical protein
MEIASVLNKKSMLIMAILFLSCVNSFAQSMKDSSSPDYKIVKVDGKFGVYDSATMKIVVEPRFDSPIIHVKNTKNHVFFSSGTGERIQIWKVRPGAEGKALVIFIGVFSTKDAPDAFAYLHK